MKVWIILLSLAVMVGVWWWQGPKRAMRRHPFGTRLFRTVAAGVASYFAMMGLALIYVFITTGSAT